MLLWEAAVSRSVECVASELWHVARPVHDRRSNFFTPTSRLLSLPVLHMRK